MSTQFYACRGGALEDIFGYIHKFFSLGGAEASAGLVTELPFQCIFPLFLILAWPTYLGPSLYVAV